MPASALSDPQGERPAGRGLLERILENAGASPQVPRVLEPGHDLPDAAGPGGLSQRVRAQPVPPLVRAAPRPTGPGFWNTERVVLAALLVLTVTLAVIALIHASTSTTPIFTPKAAPTPPVHYCNAPLGYQPTVCNP